MSRLDTRSKRIGAAFAGLGSTTGFVHFHESKILIAVTNVAIALRE